uniref:Uncharacterized protein n=1 Tax=Fagus sylvatica TaxID=28930 RepID=A0A2N9JBJ8_FAGSY
MKVFQRALQYNDPKKVYLALLGMYERTEQHKLGGELLDKVVKKFKHSCKVWLRRVHLILKQQQDVVAQAFRRYQDRRNPTSGATSTTRVKTGRRNKAVAENSGTFPTDVATLARRVFLTRNKLIREPGHVGKKTHSCTTWNSRIAKILSGQAGILIGKLPSNGPKTLRWPLFAEPYLTSPSSDFRKSGTLQKFEEKRAGRKTHFSSRTAAFARRVFPARNKLIYEPGCVGKITTPATSWNSRFAESIPRLIGIFTGKVHENSSDTPTSGSHNSLIRTPIHANFIPLERGRRELSGDMLHDPF